jgi:hypothetical protein
MNFAERLTGLYLRLNGFLLMPAFSTFTIRPREEDRKAHAHIDILGFRPPGSFEQLEDVRFPVDALLFKCLESRVGEPLDCPLAVVCEVRTNQLGEFPRRERCDYARSMCGGIEVIPMCFDDSLNNVRFEQSERGIRVGLAHAYGWIAARISWLEERQVPKLASWNWSESMLAEVLVLSRLQCQRDERQFEMLVPEDRPRQARRNRLRDPIRERR